MRRALLMFPIFGCCVLGRSFIGAQVHVTVRIQGLPTDTVWFGTTWGKRAKPFLAAVKKPDGAAELISDSVLPAGVYAIAFKRGRNAKYTFLSVLLTDEHRKFRVDTRVDQPYGHAGLSGAPLAAAYVKYYDGFQTRLRLRDSLNDMWRLRETAEDFQALVRFEKSLRDFQLAQRRAYPHTLLDTLIEWTLLPDPMAWTDSTMPLHRRRAVREQAYREAALKASSAPDLQRRMTCPLWLDWLDLAVFKLYNQVEPTRQLAEEVLNNLRRHEATYQYYFTYMINSFAGMSRFSLDEVFLHLYNTYVKTGKAPWLEEDNRSKLETQAAGMPGTLIGDQARNAPVVDRHSQKMALDSLLKGYTLLVFWDPECGHCQKELPELKTLCAPYQARGLRVITVCMAKGPRAQECWDFTDSRQLPSNWLYLREPDGSAVLTKSYNLRSFPRIYLLDPQKTIIYRRSGEVPAYELRSILDKFIP